MNGGTDSLATEPEDSGKETLLRDLVYIGTLSFFFRVVHQFSVLWYLNVPNTGVHRIYQNEYSVFHNIDVYHYLNPQETKNID